MKTSTTAARNTLIFIIFHLICFPIFAQPIMETGGQKMPDEWIDKSTGHKVINLTRRTGNNYSFYFHNNPFIGDKMIFYGTDFLNTSKNDSVKQEISNIAAGNKQIYTVDLKTLKVDQVWFEIIPHYARE